MSPTHPTDLGPAIGLIRKQLEHALLTVVEAEQHHDKGEHNAAAGALIPLETELPVIMALITATLALHRANLSKAIHDAAKNGRAR